MKKICMIFCFIILILMHNSCYAIEEQIIASQKNNLDISNFLQEAQKYKNSIFPDTNVDQLLTDAIKGNINQKKMVDRILHLLGDEIKNTIRTLACILMIVVIHSVFKSVSENLGNQSIAQITYYVQYILIVTLMMSNFTDIIDSVRNSIQNLISFMQLLIPLLITLMVTTGSIVSANVVQPILLFAISFIGSLISHVILPILLVATVLGIVSQISSKFQIDKLTKFFNATSIWILGIVLTVFVGLLSLEGTLSSSVDGLTAKTTKAAVSTFIPVVGKVLGDSVDTVLGCASILKNAVGIVGVVVLLAICIAPIVKLTILTITYYLASAICQPIADERIIKLFDTMGETFKILLAITVSVAIMFMIGITIVIKISNSGLMYR